MKAFLRVTALISLLVLGSQNGLSQNCYYGYGNIYGEQPYFWDTYTVGEQMPVSWSFDWGYNTSEATISIDISTDAGGSWIEVASGVNMEENCSGCWSGNTTITIPWTIQPSDKCIVRFREVPNDESSCAYNYDGYNYYNQSYEYGYYFTIQPGCYQPLITQQPADQAGCEGYPYTVSVGVDVGPNPSYFTYDWYKDGNLISSSNSSPNLYFPSVSASDAGSYNLMVTNQCDYNIKWMNSRNMSFNMNTPAALTQVPASTTVCLGATVTLSGSAVGTNVQYRWYRDGVRLPLETSNTLTIASVTVGDAATYNFEAQASCGPAVRSADAIVSVPPAPAFTIQPVGGGFCKGSDVTLIAAAAGTGVSYQWYKNETPVPGGIQSTITIRDFSNSSAGIYWAKATVINGGCTLTSSSDRVNVYAYGAPVVTLQPQSVVVCTGTETALFVIADGTDLHYTWYHNGAVIQNVDNYMLRIEDANASDVGSYSVEVTSICGGSITSDVASIQVVQQPKIIYQPTDQNLVVGGLLLLTLGVTDAQQVTWWHNNSMVYTGPSTTYTKQNVQLSDAGFYTAVIKSVCGAVSSRNIQIVVTETTNPVPMLVLSSEQLNIGDVPVGYSKTASFTDLITNVGTADLVINSLALQGAESSVFTIVGNTTPTILQPGQSMSVTALMFAQARGSKTATLFISSNAQPAVNTIGIQGKGVVLYNINTAQFGNVNVGEKKNVCMTVSNTSSASIILDNITSNQPEFTVTTTLPLTITGGGSADVCVDFQPESSGNKSTQFTLLSSTGGNSTTTAVGVGVSPTSITEEASVAGVVVYPNPTNGTITINTASVVAQNIRIVSARGETVATIAPEQSITTWDLNSAANSPVASGLYTIVIETERGWYSLSLSIIR